MGFLGFHRRLVFPQPPAPAPLLTCADPRLSPSQLYRKLCLEVLVGETSWLFKECEIEHIALVDPPSLVLFDCFSLSLSPLQPMTTGAAFLYTSSSCAMESFRNQRDWKNSAVGGALAGGLFMGVKRGTPAAALVGALIFGAAASAPDWCVNTSRHDTTCRHAPL